MSTEVFSSEPVVKVSDATIFQDHNSVLNNVNFEIEKGEFTYIVGRTGSGKSSLMKTLYADLPLRFFLAGSPHLSKAAPRADPGGG